MLGTPLGRDRRWLRPPTRRPRRVRLTGNGGLPMAEHREQITTMGLRKARRKAEGRWSDVGAAGAPGKPGGERSAASAGRPSGRLVDGSRASGEG